MSASCSETGQLAEMPGIGKSTLAKIEEFVKTGTIKAHQELLARIPPSLLELLRIPGVGPKSVKTLYQNLHIGSIADLKQALDDGLVETLPGFGQKKAAAIRRGIEFLEKATGRIRLDQALAAAHLVTALPAAASRASTGLRPRARCGAAPRPIGDVDILVATGRRAREGTPHGVTANEQLIESFTDAPFVERVLGAGGTKGSAIIRTETTPVQVDVRVVPPESFGAALQYFTGSKAHNVRLREIAMKAKLKLNEYGLFEDDTAVAGAVEEEIYAKLGLDFIDPRLREDRGEVEAAKKHALPKLVRLEDIRGDFHAHTTATDGSATIEEMAQAAQGAGLRVPLHHRPFAIHRHRQRPVAPAARASRSSKSTRSTRDSRESPCWPGPRWTFWPSGALDFEDKLLADLDYVVASIHSALGSPASGSRCARSRRWTIPTSPASAIRPAG